MQIEQCVGAVDADPGVVVAYAKAQFVDANGASLDLFDPGWHVVSEVRSERLRYAIEAVHFVNPLHGVIRTDSLRRTRLIPAYPAGDYRLMAEVALLGKIVEIPEPLFIRRIRKGSTKGNQGDRSWLGHYWTGSTARNLRAGYWRPYRDHVGLLLRAPFSGRERLMLLARVARRMLRSRRLLLGELVELLRPWGDGRGRVLSGIRTPFDDLQTEPDDPRCAGDHLTLPVRIQQRVNLWISAV